MSQLVHVFMADSRTTTTAPAGAKKDGPKLTWKVVLRTGTWKKRPGPGGVKLDQPLTIYRDKAPKGHLSMTSIVKNFYGDEKGPAKEHVTFPTVHADGTITDSGFVRELVIQDVYGEDGTKATQSLLWAGIEITDSAMKTKIDEKSIVGCSGGILFDYERPEDGKKFDQVLTHVMATNSPWIGGCGGYVDKLPEGVMAADERPDEEIEVVLDAPVVDGGIVDTGPASSSRVPEGTVVWRPEEGFAFMKGKVQRALENWRRSVLAAMPENKRHYDDFPYMSVEDVSHDGTQGKALIKSGYGNEAVHWVANFKLDDEKDAVVEPFQNWTEAAQEWVAASEEQAPAPAPSSVQKSIYVLPKDRVQLSELRRAQTSAVGSHNRSTPTNHHHGGRPMSKLSELLASGIELSDYQKRLADEALEEERLAQERAARDAQRAREGAAMALLSELDKLGLGDNDTPGLRAYVRNVVLSDEGGTAINLSEVTDSGQRTQPVPTTATEIVKGLIEALPRNAEGKIALSEQARVIPGDEKPPEGEQLGGDKKDDLTPQQRADALLSEGDGFDLDLLPMGGGN